MSWHQPKFNETNLATAARCSLPIPSAPIPGVNTPYVITEDIQQFLANASSYVPLALNTAHPEYTDFVLVSETDPVDVGGGQMRWKRTYAKKPAQHNEWESFDFKFPGIADLPNIGGKASTRRTPYSDKVTSRLQHDYFLVGNVSAGADYATPGDIPKVYATMFVLQGQLNGVTGIADGTWVGAVWCPTEYLANDAMLGGVYLKSSPTTDEYRAMVTDAIANGWDSDVTVQDMGDDAASSSCWIWLPGGSHSTAYGGQIVAEDSRLTRWMGNIWLRTTRYVLAY